MRKLKELHGLYSLQKTLRFKLIPEGKTQSFIDKNRFLEFDEHRAQSYKEAKKIIDEYHKVFIEESLSNCKLVVCDNGKGDSLAEFFIAYKNKDVKTIETIQAKLRKQIAISFKKNEKFGQLFKKELIIDLLPNSIVDSKKREVIDEFKKFTTYFSVFNQNRNNIYTQEAKSTGIAFRLINQNLVRHIDNLVVFNKVKQTDVASHFDMLYREMEAYLNVASIDEIFELQYFNMTLTQTQIDVYNAIIGGKSHENDTRVKGLNEYINLYNQQIKDKKDKLPLLTPLYKQILSDRQKISYIPDQFENDTQVLESIQACYRELEQVLFESGAKGELSLENLLAQITNFDLGRIYIRNDESLTAISQSFFGNWEVIPSAVKIKLQERTPQKKKESDEKYQARIDKLYKAISINEINNYIRSYVNEEKYCPIQHYFSSLGKSSIGSGNKLCLFEKVHKSYSEIKKLLNEPYPKDKNLAQDRDATKWIKALLDSLKAIQHFIKPLIIDESDKDLVFYASLERCNDMLNEVLTPIYNMVRNYMTRKPFSTAKIKVNFENSSFLSGWNEKVDFNTRSGVLLHHNDFYYLAIVDKKLSEDEQRSLKNTTGATNGKRLFIDFQPSDNKNPPRLFIRSKGDKYAPAVIEHQLPIEDIIDIYDNGLFKTAYKKIDEKAYYKALYALIDYFKLGFSKHESYRHFEFKWKETSQYQNINEFYKDVESSCYQIKLMEINWDYLNQLVDEGKIYLFKIYNKDFSAYSKGTPNLHTLYWKMLFDSENAKDVVYKLNGGAEIFYRKSSLRREDTAIHKANEPVKNKNKANSKKESLFTYDLIKDKRYTVDQYQFHVPITLNFQATNTAKLNDLVCECIKNNGVRHVIGIDRGERHLLYITVLDLNGNIVLQESLNTVRNSVNGNNYDFNYQSKLVEKEEERRLQRRDWNEIENIKELKGGYMSQIVHYLSKLIVKYDAIIVLEDLNFGFKRSRTKVERQVYQKFEHTLIDKLNYLVDKQQSNLTAPTGLLRALQLTDKVDSYSKIRKQEGVLFYVPAWNTSKIDPVTGFVNLLDTRYENREKSKSFFDRFDSIKYNQTKEWIEFNLDYTKFTKKAVDTRTKWVLCTSGERIEQYRDRTQNNNWTTRVIKLNEEFLFLFKERGFDLSKELKTQICNIDDKDFFEALHRLMKLMLQMRNSEINSDIDYIISPALSEEGVPFDSRYGSEKLPKNADANGAYNIARKGLCLIERIKQMEDRSKLELFISNKEWLQYSQK